MKLPSPYFDTYAAKYQHLIESILLSVSISATIPKKYKVHNLVFTEIINIYFVFMTKFAVPTSLDGPKEQFLSQVRCFVPIKVKMKLYQMKITSLQKIHTLSDSCLNNLLFELLAMKMKM